MEWIEFHSLVDIHDSLLNQIARGNAAGEEMHVQDAYANCKPLERA